ncbi:efflux RND transporter periplasmic adaptor subunit [candidate division GN15 bacterium]|nr:efflux RND transporter periplasmic adaptor subunit [candidate division GN15 bacterium]
MTRFSPYRYLLIGVILIALAGCSRQEQAQQSERVLSVRADVLTSRDLELGRTYTGSLEGERQAVLYAKLAEAVDSIWVSEDNRVAADQVIMSLDKTGPSTKYREARSTFENAQKNYRKMKFLYEKGAISEVEFDNAELAYEVARADFDAVRQLVEIQTPIAGVVTAINVRAGDLVSVGTRLATVATTDRLRVRFGVNPEEIGSFTIGSQVRVTAEGAGGSGTGTIKTIASSADPMTRTFEVEAIIDNSEGRFRPGMFVRIQYISDRLSDVLAVPRRAVLRLDNVPTVFTVKDGQARMHQVVLGPDIDGLVVIDSGLAVGDTLVVLGQDYLEDSVQVNITELSEQTR